MTNWFIQKWQLYIIAQWCHAIDDARTFVIRTLFESGRKVSFIFQDLKQINVSTLRFDLITT